jgi:hypothetical protein
MTEEHKRPGTQAARKKLTSAHPANAQPANGQPANGQHANGQHAAARPVGPVAAPPVKAPPVKAPPVKAPPVKAPPVAAPPVAAPPVAAPPVAAPPVAAQHAEAADQRKRAAVSSGNPRITVAFPFSRIDIKEPSEPLRELAALVEQLAEQAVMFASHAAPDHVEEADRLAAQAAALAHRLAG